MDVFPPGARFKYPWRPYQARILQELQGHLADDRLHVVAAPGSGKTVLGLEVARRIDKPVLVLAPTLAIRDQWVDRFVELFLGNERPAWISNDVRSPAFFTVATYQGLHAACTGEDERDGAIEGLEIDEELLDGLDAGEDDDNDDVVGTGEMISRVQPASTGRGHRKGRASSRTSIRAVVAGLLQAGTRTVVVDEAHHLRASWWWSLTAVLDGLDAPTVLALTATPPFDVPAVEWNRYITLCGPVDAEVTVPELVKVGNLCPHQDFIHVSIPEGGERELLDTVKGGIREFIDKLLVDGEFNTLLLDHPFIKEGGKHVEAILDDPDLLSAMLVFLQATGSLHLVPETTIELVCGKGARLPAVSPAWLEVLLGGLLFPRSSMARESPVLDRLKRELARAGALERRRVLLSKPKGVEKVLSMSASKLSGIVDIVRVESRTLGEVMRAVILTDFIRKSLLPNGPLVQDEASSLPPEARRHGVAPIFEAIRRSAIPGVRPSMLSGSLVAIPASAATTFRDLAIEAGADAKSIRFEPMSHDPSFVEVLVAGQDAKKIVAIMTSLFARGGTNIIVGTKSLLGEGWDAPSINTLILASFVGSFMLSNQMRGRAIRVEHGNPDKVANVWHLACVDPGDETGGPDLEALARRFKAFSGVAFDAPVIETGIDRLGLGGPPFKKDRVAAINDRMVAGARDRAATREGWARALERGNAAGGRFIDGIKAEPSVAPRDFVFKHTIGALIAGALAIASDLVTLYAFMVLRSGIIMYWPGWVLLLGVIIVSLVLVPRFVKALILVVRHGRSDSSLGQVAMAVLKALCISGTIRTSFKELSIEVSEDHDRYLHCALHGATGREKETFLDALEEVLGPVANPRYVLVHHAPPLLGRLRRTDYFPVPAVLGARKKDATVLAKTWNRHVGRADLVYTRTKEGRLDLLKARAGSSALRFADRTSRFSKWE